MSRQCLMCKTARRCCRHSIPPSFSYFHALVLSRAENKHQRGVSNPKDPNGMVMQTKASPHSSSWGRAIFFFRSNPRRFCNSDAGPFVSSFVRRFAGTTAFEMRRLLSSLPVSPQSVVPARSLLFFRNLCPNSAGACSCTLSSGRKQKKKKTENGTDIKRNPSFRPTKRGRRYQ